MRHGIVVTITAGATRHHIVEAWITDVPDDKKPTETAEALSESPHAAEYSEHGIFLANRKVIPEDKLPKGTRTPESAPEIPWKALAGTESVQLNIRTTAAKRARWEMAASAAGHTGRNAFGDWIRQTLDAAAADALNQG